MCASFNFIRWSKKIKDFVLNYRINNFIYKMNFKNPILNYNFILLSLFMLKFIKIKQEYKKDQIILIYFLPIVILSIKKYSYKKYLFLSEH